MAMQVGGWPLNVNAPPWMLLHLSAPSLTRSEWKYSRERGGHCSTTQISFVPDMRMRVRDFRML